MSVEDLKDVVMTRGLGHVSVEQRTPELCRFALKVSKGKAIRFVEPQTEELCLLAVRQDVSIPSECAFLQIRPENRTETVCIAAVTTCSSILQFIEAQTEAICIAAVRARAPSWGLKPLQMVTRQTHAICLAAVTANGRMLEFVDAGLRTADICLAAVRSDGLALRFVPALTYELYLAAVQQTGLALEYIQVEQRSFEICETAIHSCVREEEGGRALLELVPVQFRSLKLCQAAIKLDGYSLEFVPDEFKSLELCCVATSNEENDNGYIMQFVPKQLRYNVYAEQERVRENKRAETTMYKILNDRVFEFNEETREVGRCVGRVSLL